MLRVARIAGIVLALAAGPIGPAGAAEPAILVSYEAIAFEPLGLDPARLGYEERAALTRTVADRVVPEILATLGIPADSVTTEVTPGGYQLQTNASLQSAIDGPDAEAERFAAAVGYVFRQWSVLVTDFAPAGDGDTAYAVVSFGDLVPSGELAQDFFEHAAAVDSGLGGGYTAFGSELYFLNVTDAAGAPYSGLPDDVFIDRLDQAAVSFEAAAVTLAGAGRVDARFIENDWSTAPNGEDYAAMLGAGVAALLEPVRAAHEAGLRASVPALVPAEP